MKFEIKKYNCEFKRICRIILKLERKIKFNINPCYEQYAEASTTRNNIYFSRNFVLSTECRKLGAKPWLCIFHHFFIIFSKNFFEKSRLNCHDICQIAINYCHKFCINMYCWLLAIINSFQIINS